MSRLICNTPAKINLGLELLGKRSDGYHEINTLFLPVTLCDTIETRISEELKAQCAPALDISDEENIVVKAAAALRRAAGIDYGAFIKITKNIPSGAGLGGGSSDAASALILLNSLWNINFNCDKLRDIAAEIGSDVPFFISKTPAVGRGRGEILQPLAFQLNCGIVIIRPESSVSTAWAYRAALPNKFHDEPSDYEKILRETPISEWKNYVCNDFERGVFRYFPDIASAKNKLYDLGADFALMSGSGSCVFGLFEDENIAQQAASNFHTSYFCRQYISSAMKN